jgi:hypothetical protein
MLRFGKEDSDKDEIERRDIIYQVYLGDRQIWERSTDEDSVVADKFLTVTWHIVKDITLKSTSEATSMVGTIDWGDNSIDNWRSGLSNTHNYFLEGDYNINFFCKNMLDEAAIARVEEYLPYTTEYKNELIGVTIGTLPIADHRLGDITKGVFEDITTIKNITVAVGATEVPKRAFYNTSFETLTIPAARFSEEEEEKLITIGERAFVSNDVKTIRVESNRIDIGTQGLGYGTNGLVVDDLKFYCYENSPAWNYAISNGITPIAII